jgi:hypothetical protein
MKQHVPPARRASAHPAPRAAAHAEPARTPRAEHWPADSPRLVAQRQRLQATLGPTVAQRDVAEEEELLQGKAGDGLGAPVQRDAPEEEELLQGKPLAADGAALQRAGLEEEEPLQARMTAAVQRAPRHDAPAAALPPALRAGIESLSGVNVSDVRVHAGSSAPAEVQAHAYAQGADIHLAPGQEQHLAHEAWHVVQQRQGRVQPTLQAAGVLINDDPALEAEADAMGERATRQGPQAPARREREGQ